MNCSNNDEKVYNKIENQHNADNQFYLNHSFTVENVKSTIINGRKILFLR